MILFKHEHLKDEFSRVDPRLRVLLFYTCGLASNELYKDIKITQLFRTQTQQDAIYSVNPFYAKQPWKSTHQVGRACDLSTRNLSRDEVSVLIDLLNVNFEYGNAKKTAIYHNVGLGDHIHLQVPHKVTSFFS